LQIVDFANVFQLPEAMKITDAFIRSAQELLFDASCDDEVDKVMQNTLKFEENELMAFYSV
jgi:hypothetical protein